MKVTLIGNYPPDKQESMERFAQMLRRGLDGAGVACEIWRPKVYLAVMDKTKYGGIGKYLGYIDKWLIAPLVLKMKMRDPKFNTPETRFHICDHSNAPYLRYFPEDKVSITCHDVLAIRGALGYADAYCPTSGLGRILQKWILGHLLQAKNLSCVSQHTLQQLKELATHPASANKNWRVIPLSFNADFAPLDILQAKEALKASGLDPNKPFLLHVGSNLERKNRKLLIGILHKLGSRWTGKAYYAGEALEEGLWAYARSLGVEHRIVSVLRPNHHTLLALYSTCEAFIFPSFSEGFGWPLIGAQACGAPVVASANAPMPEVSAGSALHADPESADEFANAFLELQDETKRDEVVKAGFANVRRFSSSRMINNYLDLFHISRIKV